MTDLWSFRPEVGCKETLEWFTDNFGGLTGEQRIALRSAPRQSFNYTTRLLDYQQFSRAKTFARRNGALPVYVPVWGEQVQLSGAISSSATTLTFNTTYGDWREDGFLVVWSSDETYAVAQIDTVSSGSITLTGALGTGFTSPVVCPVRTAILTNGMSIQRAYQTKTDVSASFLVTDNIDLADDYVTDFPQYTSLDVLTEAAKLVTDINESIVRASEFIDNGFGPIVVETTKDYADFGQMLSFHDARGAALWRRRLWLHSLRGKQKTFWLPSFNMDLQLQTSFLAAATSVVVKSIAPSGFYLNKHVMILLANGNRYFREITNAASAGGGNDALTISSALGENVAPADVKAFCFLSLVRLNSDSVDIEHSFTLDSVVSIPVMEVPA
jgi:hypothetical protein